ncbi:hypothetical protein F2Q69_00047979 [Brassica cretica]|uniref:Uncharacterized protein n=1 Tax=Brassica cretica TaxID=69181 RepID=A0A8S9PVS6_BRACR|nr:hypothetical protein F2Q69_00047979 [Brassica cretica]
MFNRKKKQSVLTSLAALSLANHNLGAGGGPRGGAATERFIIRDNLNVTAADIGITSIFGSVFACLAIRTSCNLFRQHLHCSRSPVHLRDKITTLETEMIKRIRICADDVLGDKDSPFYSWRSTAWREMRCI